MRRICSDSAKAVRKPAVIILVLIAFLTSAAICGSQETTAQTEAAIARLQSTDLKERAFALLTLRRPEASAAIPALIQMLGNDMEFPQAVLMVSNDWPILNPVNMLRLSAGKRPKASP